MSINELLLYPIRKVTCSEANGSVRERERYTEKITWTKGVTKGKLGAVETTDGLQKYCIYVVCNMCK